jgi:Alpha-L-arabinofuranosidase B (ABFB) domain/F5/8 type C domain
MKLLALPKVLNKPYVLAAILAVVIVVVVGVYLYRTAGTKEGFYPVNTDRINLEKTAKRRYNEYADTQDVEKVGIIPAGDAGDPIIKGLLATPSYTGTNKTKNLGGLNYDDELQYKAPPENTMLLTRIKMCESVKTWDCNSLDQPDFAKYCGICTKDGQDHLGNKMIGGMYIDPDMKKMIESDAQMSGTAAVYTPTVGICKGEFILTRPKCDIQKDRFEVSQAQNFNNPAAMAKGAFCANGANNTFVYIGSREGKDKGYALNAKPVKFTARLRFAVTHPNEATITVTRGTDQKTMAGAYIPGTNVYIVDLPGASENDKYNINVSYPEYAPYAWTADDTARINALVNPKRASLVRAMYGPVTDDFTKDDPRAVDVTQYVKDKFRISDCSNTAVKVTNDGLGGDPTPGIYKQARLVYSDNGQDFAYAYGKEGGTTTAQNTASLQTLCPPNTSASDAQKAVCEINGDQTPSGRTYTGGKNQNYPGAAGAWCVSEAPRKDRGIVGIWESVGSAPRTVPLDLSVLQINGFNVPQEGPPKLGTVKSSKKFAALVPPSKAIGIPDYLFWFWARDSTLNVCDFSVVVPATFRDATILDDNTLCPTGPLVSTPEAAARLQAGACEKLINGQPQGPGTYTTDCIKSLFLSSGCTTAGKAFPNTPEKIKAASVDPITKSNLDADTINSMMTDRYVIATTGSNSDGLRMEQDSYASANMDCFGKFVSNPCDTAFKETGPHTPACLDYLFRNAGKDNASIGQTYPGQYNRSSGTDRTAATPIMYCQRAGTMSPVGADGKPDYDAIATANSYGGVQNVREFYRQIHFDANYNGEGTAQKIALNQCYGVGVKAKAPVCKGTKARYIRVRPTTDFGDNWIQISQLQAFNVNDVNVAYKKPTSASSTYANGQYGSTSDKAVDGSGQARAFPAIFHAGSTDISTTYWQVDLQKMEEISYVVYYNRQDCCQHRARGMRVQLVDENDVVIKEKKLSGNMMDTLLFSNVKPTGLLKAGTELQFVPGKYSGSAMTLAAGGEVLIKTKLLTAAYKQSASFVAVAGNAGLAGTFSFKHMYSNTFLRVQGFRVRVTPDDGTVAFKNESSFKVSDSVAGNPGEISYESVSNAGSYLAVAENMGVYVSPATSLNQQKLASWRLTPA